jgi:hypothetical protein
MVGPIGLWSHGEITAGFLVLCVPSTPKAYQNSIFAKKLSMFGSSRRSSGDHINSRKGLPSWYRAKTSRKPRHMDVSTLEERTLFTVRSDAGSKHSDIFETDFWEERGADAARPQVVYLRTHGLV